MRKHMEMKHEGNSQDCKFEWKIVGSFQRPIQRQLTEAVYIANTKKNAILNLENEYCSNTLKGVSLNKKDCYECQECGRKFSMSNDLKNHFTNIHERLSCVKCDFISFGVKDLKNHVERNHLLKDKHVDSSRSFLK